MRWQGGRESSNVEDRRGMRGGPVMLGGGLGTIILVLIVMFLGGDPRALLDQMGKAQQGGGGAAVQRGEEPDPAQEETKQFVAVILADTEDVWNDQFRRAGKQYQEPTLVLFTDQVQSACGLASAAVGPFYCPADSKVYLDMAFFRELELKFKAPGDFAQAYVVAHEVGHHVQNLLGLSDKVHNLQRRVDKVEGNKLSVRLELQADYLAGVWAHHAQKAKQYLDRKDLEDGLRAATAIGDDRLQKQAQGHVVPDSFTHGSSEQRVRWFSRGLETGDFSKAQLLFEVDESEL